MSITDTEMTAIGKRYAAVTTISDWRSLAVPQSRSAASDHFIRHDASLHSLHWHQVAAGI